MKLSNIVNEVLYEDSIKKVDKGLKLFYNVDVFLKEEPKETPQQPAAPTAPAPAPAVAPQPQPAQVMPQQESFKSKVRGYMGEEEEKEGNDDDDKEDSKFVKKGVITLSADEANNIQTMEDMVDYLGDARDGGAPIINEFIEEVILNVIGTEGSTVQLQDLLKKDDKLIVEIEYGSNVDDSIGFKLLKRSGVDTISMMLKKDGNILPGKFSKASFEQQIIAYRNSLEKSNGQ